MFAFVVKYPADGTVMMKKGYETEKGAFIGGCRYARKEVRPTDPFLIAVVPVTGDEWPRINDIPDSAYTYRAARRPY